MLTAIMVAYNEAPWLESTIRACLDTAGCDLDFVLVDDASTDATPEIAARLPIRYIGLGERRGVSYCRNTAGSEAGHPMTFLDAHVWPKPGWGAAIERALYERPDAIIVPAWGNFEGRKHLLPERGGAWETSLALAQRDGTPINRGSGLVFTVRHHWFYLCVDRRIEPRLKRHNAGHAVGMSMTRKMFDRLGGWVNLPGHWGGNDAAISMKAWFLDVPILCEPAAQLLHMVKDPCTHAVSRDEETLNRHYTAWLLFDEAFYHNFWQPGLTKCAGWRDWFECHFTTDAALAEREAWRGKPGKQSEADFMAEFVWPRMEAGKG